MSTQTMTQTQSDERAMRNAAMLFGIAGLAVAISLLAGLILVLAEPDAGSNAEAVLGITAAVAGLSTAFFVIAGLIYMQVKNLWRFMPTWLRIAAWVVIALGVALTLWGWVSQAA